VASEPKATHIRSHECENPAFNMFNDYIYNQLTALDIQDEYNTYYTAFLLLKEPPSLIQY
jgi:hypothetical protein